MFRKKKINFTILIVLPHSLRNSLIKALYSTKGGIATITRNQRRYITECHVNISLHLVTSTSINKVLAVHNYLTSTKMNCLNLWFAPRLMSRFPKLKSFISNPSFVSTLWISETSPSPMFPISYLII